MTSHPHILFRLSIPDKALIALNYFDRMMMSQRRLQRDQFQVAAIACLFISSKLFQKKHLKVSAVSFFLS